MDNLYALAACIAVVFGAWIGWSGLRRWQGRDPVDSAGKPVEPPARSGFPMRAQLQTLSGLLIFSWGLRVLILYAMQLLIPKPSLVQENSVTGRVETLPTTNKLLDQAARSKVSVSTASPSQPDHQE